MSSRLFNCVVLNGAAESGVVRLIRALIDSTPLPVINYQWLKYHITVQAPSPDPERDRFVSHYTLTHL